MNAKRFVFALKFSFFINPWRLFDWHGSVTTFVPYLVGSVIAAPFLYLFFEGARWFLRRFLKWEEVGYLPRAGYAQQGQGGRRFGSTLHLRTT